MAPWGHLGEPWEQQTGLLGGVACLQIGGGFGIACLGVSEQSLFFVDTGLYGLVCVSPSVFACAPLVVWPAGLRFFSPKYLSVCWLVGYWMLIFRS